MDTYCKIELTHPFPFVTTALHQGHEVSNDVEKLLALDQDVRLREEDPFTGIWAGISKNQIIGRFSRFEFDLNRPPDRAIYVNPEDAWGLQVWKTQPPGEILQRSLSIYNKIYERFRDGMEYLLKRSGALVVLDFHSYNYRRAGPASPPDDPDLNPEINIGTGTMDRETWAHLVDRFMDELRKADFLGRQLDVRENVRFRGGYFPTWIHANFNREVCCISVEIKKIYMDEWTGEPYWNVIDRLREIFESTLPGLMEELALRGKNQN